MNGRITIMLGGVSTPLTFGMLAIEEFGNRQAIGHTGWTKLITDLIYSGYCNEEIVNGRSPVLTYREIAESVEELVLKVNPIITEVYKCFESSKAGSNLMGNLKKKALEDPELQKPKRTKKQTGTKSKDSLSES